MEKIKKGDTIKVTSGKDAGKTGKVLRMVHARGRGTVEGVNMVIKHLRPRREGEKGQRVQFPATLSIANMRLVCPQCGQMTRVGFVVPENGSKMRTCKKCNAQFP